MTQAQPMNTHEQFCPNPECKARGQRGAGNITLHSQKRRRYQCTCCGKTFSERTGTMFAGLRTDPTTLALHFAPRAWTIGADSRRWSEARFLALAVGTIFFAFGLQLLGFGGAGWWLAVEQLSEPGLASEMIQMPDDEQGEKQNEQVDCHAGGRVLVRVVSGPPSYHA